MEKLKWPHWTILGVAGLILMVWLSGCPILGRPRIDTRKLPGTWRGTLEEAEVVLVFDGDGTLRVRAVPHSAWALRASLPRHDLPPAQRSKLLLFITQRLDSGTGERLMRAAMQESHQFPSLLTSLGKNGGFRHRMWIDSLVTSRADREHFRWPPDWATQRRVHSLKEPNMTRADLTDITFVLDRSGSMQSIKQATIEAFNGFLTSQKTGAGAAQMTLVQFDDQYEMLYRGVPIARALELTEQSYQPRASTALLDAMGRMIIATGERFRQLPEHQRPGTVMFVTLTDGYENASHEYTLQRVNELIREQRDKYAWQFVFLGANQDAIATAAQMGVDAAQAMTFSASESGARGVLGAFNNKLHRVRAACAKGGVGAQIEFDTDDRNAALGD